MSKFKWEISEPARDAASGIPGGTLHLENIKVVSRIPPWVVGTPAAHVARVPQPGGEVGLEKLNASKETASGAAGIIDRRVINLGLIVLIVLVALLVMNDMRKGSMSFAQFAEVIVSFFAGVGWRNINGKRPPGKATKRRKSGE
jgi:hypothetical protein